MHPGTPRKGPGAAQELPKERDKELKVSSRFPLEHRTIIKDDEICLNVSLKSFV